MTLQPSQSRSRGTSSLADSTAGELLDPENFEAIGPLFSTHPVQRLRTSFSRLSDSIRGIPPLALLAEEHLALLAQSVHLGERAPNTLITHRSRCKHLVRLLGDKRPTELTVELLRWAKGRLSPSTWNKALDVIRAILDRCVARGWVARNVARDPEVKPCRLRGRTCRLQPDEYTRVIQALAEIEAEDLAWPSVCAALRLILLTGARKSEICRLEWTGVDLDARIIDCGISKKQIARYGLSDQAIELIRAQPRMCRWVFPGAKPGTHVVQLYHAWNKARTRAGVSLPIHGLRHSWVTLAVLHGSMEGARLAIGHSSAHMTSKYSHLAVRDALPLIQVVGEAIERGAA
jgi:integrase